MTKLDRILVPMDFSENSKAALQYARGLAEQFGAEVHLLHVISNDTTMAIGSDGFFSVSDSVMQEIRDAVTRQLQESAATIQNSVKQVVQETREGAPFAEIVQYAKSNDIDMIVLGTHGRTGISHLLIGSVAEKVVRKARCPVLTIPLTDHEFVMP